MKILKTLIHTFLLLGFTALAAQVETSDSLALVDFYNALDGPNWTENNNWLSNKPVSEWQGIAVNLNKVHTISLTNNQLKGSMPDAVNNLDGLQELHLGENNISSIPENLSNLTNLRVIRLYDNALSEFPLGILDCNALENVNLYYNQIAGTIPAQLNNLTNLQELSLEDNQLSGQVPALKSLTNLQEVSFAINQDLTGNLQDIFKDELQLTNFSISYTNISGDIKESYFNPENSLYIFADNTRVDEIDAFTDFTISRIWLRNAFVDFQDLLPFQNNPNVDDFKYHPQKNIHWKDEFTSPYGSTVQLECIIEGGTTYTWYKDDTPIQEGTDANYTIDNFQASDEGSYHCSVTNPDLPLLEMTQDPTILLEGVLATNTSSISSVDIYPNPCIDYLFINSDHLIQSIHIWNAQGKLIHSVEPHDSNFLMDVKDYPAGPYFLTIQSSHHTRSYQFFKE